MLDISKITVNTVKPTGTPESAKAAADVFKTLHGMYGTIFLSKYQTGQLDDKGRDMGIQSARSVWAVSLAKFDRDVIGMALDSVLESTDKFPPSLPEFTAICKAKMPREAYKPAPLAIGMSSALAGQYSRKAREAAMQNLKKSVDAKTGYKALPTGLAGLKQAIANAVATAGGDEVAELLRLDRMFAKKVSAC